MLAAAVVALGLAQPVQSGIGNCGLRGKCPSPIPSPSPSPTASPSPTSTPTSSWRLLIDQTFSTPAAEGQFLAVYPTWFAYKWGWHDTSGNGSYDPSIISVHDGLADIYIRTTAGVHRVATIGPYLSGTVRDQLYGRYEVRARVDSMHGYKGAWLLWPGSEVWPRDGEIDAPEADFDASSVHAYLHHQDATSSSDQDAFSSGITWNDWHTWATEWTPTATRFYVDGRLYGTSVNRIPNTPMHWDIQNETTLGGFVPADSVSGHVLIDEAKVWAYQ